MSKFSAASFGRSFEMTQVNEEGYHTPESDSYYTPPAGADEVYHTPRSPSPPRHAAQHGNILPPTGAPVPAHQFEERPLRDGGRGKMIAVNDEWLLIRPNANRRTSAEVRPGDVINRLNRIALYANSDREQDRLGLPRRGHARLPPVDPRSDKSDRIG
jgi:hypothetical protein